MSYLLRRARKYETRKICDLKYMYVDRIALFHHLEAERRSLGGVGFLLSVRQKRANSAPDRVKAMRRASVKFTEAEIAGGIYIGD